MPDWTVEDIERQSRRGGVNRQEVLFLIDTITSLTAKLEDAEKMRDAWEKAWFADTDRLEDELEAMEDAIAAKAAWWDQNRPLGAAFEVADDFRQLIGGDDG